jgi:hypothetical protein
MSLGRFATVVGASPRWVQNALQALGLPRVYNEEAAKTLGLVRLLHETFSIPLVEAHPLATEALAAWPTGSLWRKRDATGAVALEMDLGRYLSSYASRLALARNWYAERKRGRRPTRRRTAPLAAAVAHGVDIGLLKLALDATPEDRLRRLDEDVAFLQSLRREEP